MPKWYRLGSDGVWAALKSAYRLNSAGAWQNIKGIYRLNSAGAWQLVHSSQQVVTSTTAPTLLNQISSPDTFYGGDTLTLTRGVYTNTTADSNTSYRMTIYKSINFGAAVSTWTVVTRQTFTGANSTGATTITASVTDEDAKDKYYFIGEIRVNNDANTVGSDTQDFETPNKVLSRISFDTSSFSVNKTSTSATFGWVVTGVPAPDGTTNYLYQDASNTASIVRITRNPQTTPAFQLDVPAGIESLNGTATTVGFGTLEADKPYRASLIIRANDGWATDSNFTKNNKGAVSLGATYLDFATPLSEPINTIAPIVSPVNNRGRWPINTTTNTTLSITNGTWSNLSTPTYSYKWEYLDGSTWVTQSNTNTVNFSNALNGFSARCTVRATNSDDGFGEVIVTGILDAGPTVSNITPINVLPNTATTFSYTITGYPTSYTIDWGDLSSPYSSGTINAGSSSTITGATTLTSPGRIVYTCNNNFVQGMKVTITGVNPTGYNISGATILDATATTFTILGTPGAAYISGGTATSDSSSIFGNVSKTYTAAATRTAIVTANPGSKSSSTSIVIQEPAPGPLINFTRQLSSLSNVARDKRFTWTAPNTGGSITKYEFRINSGSWGSWADVPGAGTTTQLDLFNFLIQASSATGTIPNVTGTIPNITGTIGTVSGSGPFTATITGMSSTSGFSAGQRIVSTPGSGSFGSGAMTITSILSSTSMSVSSTATFTSGTVSGIFVFTASPQSYRTSITGMSSTSGFSAGDTITSQSETGSFGAGTVTITSITGPTSMNVSSTSTFMPGSVSSIFVFLGGYLSSITGMSTTSGFYPGQIIIATPGGGNFGFGTMTVLSVISSTSMNISSTANFVAGSVTNIIGNIGHTVEVRAVGPGGNGTASSSGTFNLPAVLTGPTVTSIQDTTASTSWTRSNNVTSGTLTLSPTITGSPFSVGTNTSQSLTTLVANTLYTATLVLGSSTSDTHQQTASFTTLQPRLNPTFSAITKTSSGYTGSVNNYNSSFTYNTPSTINGDLSTGTWTWGSPSGSNYPFTVSGLTAGQSAGAVVRTTRTGYSDGSGNISGTALFAALNPAFGTLTQGNQRIDSSVTNYDANWTWSFSVSAGTFTWGTASGSTRPFSVTGLSNGQSTTVTITTTRTDYIQGSNSQSGSALSTGLTPSFGANTSGTNSFAGSVTNYNESYNWFPSVSSGTFTWGTVPAGGIGTRPFSVTGLSAGASATVTVITTRTGFLNGSNSTTGSASLATGLTPTFGTLTRGDGRIDSSVTNYDANYSWSLTASVGTVSPTTFTGTGTTKTFSVTGLSDGQGTTVTVTTTRTGYTNGSNSQSGSALDAGLTPSFGANSSGTNLFVGSVSNYNTDYGWSSSLNPSTATFTWGSLPANNPGTRTFTVGNLAAGSSATLTLITSRSGFKNGSGSTTGSAAAGLTVPGIPSMVYDSLNNTVTNYAYDISWTASTGNGTIVYQLECQPSTDGATPNGQPTVIRPSTGTYSTNNAQNVLVPKTTGGVQNFYWRARARASNDNGATWTAYSNYPGGFS